MSDSLSFEILDAVEESVLMHTEREDQLLDVVVDETTMLVHIEREDDPMTSLCGKGSRSNIILVASPNETSYHRCTRCVVLWDDMVPKQSHLSKMMEWLDEEMRAEQSAFIQELSESELIRVPAKAAKSITLSGSWHEIEKRVLGYTLITLDTIKESGILTKPMPIRHRSSMFLNILLSMNGHYDED